MQHTISVLSGTNAVVRVSEASAALSRVENILDGDGDATVVLDFTGVGRFSHEAIDALLAPLFDRLGDALPERVFFDGCAASVLADLREIAEADRPDAGTVRDRSPAQGCQAA